MDFQSRTRNGKDDQDNNEDYDGKFSLAIVDIKAAMATILVCLAHYQTVPGLLDISMMIIA